MISTQIPSNFDNPYSNMIITIMELKFNLDFDIIHKRFHNHLIYPIVI